MRRADCRIGQIVGIRPTGAGYEVYGRIVQVATHVDLVGHYLNGQALDQYSLHMATEFRRQSLAPEELTLVREHECPSCTCGMITVSWSSYVRQCFSTDVDGLTSIIKSWAFDDPHNRGGESLPYGLPANIAQVVRPVVQRYLSAMDPRWLTRLLAPTLDQTVAFTNELKAAIERVV